MDNGELELLESMTPEERAVYLLTESVSFESAYHQQLLAEWKAGNRSIMSEAREQGRRVQAWVRRLNEAKAKLAKTEQSSKQSES